MAVKHHAKRGRRFIAALFFSLTPQIVAAATAADLFGRFDLSAVNELEPIKSSIDRWGQDFDGGERQWILAYAELGVRIDSLEVSVFSRALADLRMNDEATRFYGRISRGESFAPGQTIPVKVAMEGFTAEGIRVGGVWTHNNLKIRSGLSIFRADNLYSGGLDGAFETTAGNEFELNAAVDYQYHRDILLRRPDVETANGTGVAADFYLEYRPHPELALELSIEDIGTQIRWREAPFTVATANTERRPTGSSGFSGLKPTIEGVEGYQERYTQRLSARYRTVVELGDGPVRLRAEAAYQFSDTFAGIGLKLLNDDTRSATVTYFPKFKTLALGYRQNRWFVTLAADSLDEQKMRAITTSFGYGY